MTSNELYEKYLEAFKERCELESKISAYIEKWENGETVLSTTLVKETIDKGCKRLEELEQLEQKLHQEFISMEEIEKKKRFADISLRAKLGEAPSNITIIGGVLSSNANESHLIGEEKTAEQLEQEKNQLLAKITLMVKNKKLTLAEASKLAKDVDVSYKFYDSQMQDVPKTNGKHN